MGISSGIEQQNYQKALDTILEQVEDMKKGIFSVFTKYLLIVENLNNPNIKSFDIINYGIANGFKLIKTAKVGTVSYDSLYHFEGQNDVAYLFEK